MLYELLRDGVKYEWTVERGEAFENLRKALVSAPILRHPDMRQEFILYSDASERQQVTNYVRGTKMELSIQWTIDPNYSTSLREIWAFQKRKWLR